MVLEDANSLIDYQSMYSSLSPALRPLFCLGMVIWIIILFCVLFVIANRHFSWALERLSGMMRLSPDMAGMTLLAFGNGAPDFFTSVFGASEEPEMILGNSIGSGLFIFTVVLGSVIIFSRTPRSQIVCADREAATRTVCIPQKLGLKVRNHRLLPFPFFRGMVLYFICLAFLFHFSFLTFVPFWMPLILIALFVIYLVASIMIYVLFERKHTEVPQIVTNESVQTQFDLTAFAEGVVTPSPLTKAGNDSADQLYSSCNLEFWKYPFQKKCLAAIYFTCWSDRWSGNVISLLIHGLLALPIAVVKLPLNLTILPVELPDEAAACEHEHASLQFLHRVRCVINPFFSIPLYAFLIFSPSSLPWYFWVIYPASALLLSILLYVTTSWRGPPKFFYLHLSQAFATCIIWIYASSKALVACLSATGAIFNISPVIMGTLVLAWGNSFGDLVSDISVSRNGSFETAVSAIYSGPVQNVLLTIGVSFLVATAQSPDRQIPLNLRSPDVHLSLVCLALTLVIIVFSVPFLFNFRIPRSFGIILISIYILYIPLEILCGLRIINPY